MTTALVVSSQSVVSRETVTAPVPTKPPTYSQMARRCLSVGRKIERTAWPRNVENKAWSVASALVNASICYMAAAERGNPSAAKDARDGGVALAKAIRLAGVDVRMAAQVLQMQDAK